MQVYLSGKRLRLKPQQLFGSGGEADVYDLGDGRALKLFKRPDHPDFSQSPDQQGAAARRLQEHQSKLQDFPADLPSKVIAPAEFAYDKRGGEIAGYAMPLVRDTEPLMRFGERAFRDQGVGNRRVARVFASLHATLSGLHRRGVVIGDFNDLNVLVNDEDAWLIDADSMQFAHYRCAMFTERFVDPLLCDPQHPRPLQVRPHSPSSDWYAFGVMLFRSLLLVDPYGGVFRPKAVAQKIPHSARPLQRLTVFHPDVQLPRTARPLESLPRPLIDHFRAVFEKDARVPFPIALLDRIDWQACSACGLEFARSACPSCGTVAPLPQPVAPGALGAIERFRTSGLILDAAIDAAGKLRVLSWEGREFRREDGSLVFRGAIDPQMRLRLLGGRTLIGRGHQLLFFDGQKLEAQQQVDCVAGLPAFDVNRTHAFWIDGGRLQRGGNLGSEYIGDVLAGQTRFWAGDQFGYGFYRAGQLTRAFVFDAQHAGINDTVPPPPVRGQLLDVHTHLSDELAWVCCKFQDRGQVRWCLQVIDRGGVELSVREFDDIAAAPWLDSLRGAAAGGKRLLVPSDAGICILQLGRYDEPPAIPGTAEHAHGGSHLLKAGDAICCANRSSVVELS